MGEPPAGIVVAPLAAELRPFLAAIEGRRVHALPGGAVYGGRWRRRPLLAAVIGDGAGRAGRSLAALTAWLEAAFAGRGTAAGGAPPRRRVERILLVGVAGGLSPGLEVGDTVRAARVIEAAGEGAPRSWAAPGGGEGTIVSAARILGTSGDKRALWRRLGRPPRALVDLESAVFVRAARRAGLRWTVVRAVSDPQEVDLPLDFAAASDAEGHVRRARVVRQLAAGPAAAGELGELRRRVAACAASLAAAAQRWAEEDGV
jgi:hypothetical protein